MNELEKEMATHSSVLAWRIPGTVKPRGLPSVGSHIVRYNLSDLAAAASIYVYECITESLCYIYIFAFRFFFIIPHYKMLSIVPYAIQ